MTSFKLPCVQCISNQHSKGKAFLIEALRTPGRLSSQISWQSAHEGKIVSPMHRSPLPSPRKYSWCLFLLDAESTPGPEGGRKDWQWKFPMTPLGIEPATFRIVARFLNQLRHRVPRTFMYIIAQNVHSLLLFTTSLCYRRWYRGDSTSHRRHTTLSRDTRNTVCTLHFLNNT